MNGWINLSAVGRIVVAGLVFGAGVPATFGLGLRLLSTAVAARPAGAGGRRSAVRPFASVLAGLCFAIVVGVAAWGIWLIVAAS